jgi:hypothetical protein
MAKRLFIVLVNTDPRNYESVAALQDRPRRWLHHYNHEERFVSKSPARQEGQEDSSPEPHRMRGPSSDMPGGN